MYIIYSLFFSIVIQLKKKDTRTYIDINYLKSFITHLKSNGKK